MDAIVNQVTVLAKGADEAARKAILTALRDLSYSIETPDDTVTRIWGLHLSEASVRAAINLKLFNHLVDSPNPLTVEKLVSLTNAEETLLARLLRHLASNAMIKETGLNEYTATHITQTLAHPGRQACIKHCFDDCGPCYQEMPAYLQKTGYRNLTDSYHTVWQDAWHTKESLFEWMMGHPKNFENFNLFMATRRENQTTWIDRYPVKGEATGLSPERALFVDVGGGIGHQCADFKAKYPDLPGRVILQDLPLAVEHAIPTPGVEVMTYDFMTPQPIKGAKFYYLRAVLHDWPDEKCRVILKNTIDASAPDSVILIDDIVTPNKGVNWQVTQIDLTMMVVCAAMERTETQWQNLFDSIGLKIVKRFVYTPSMYETVTAVVPK
ncbi:S-adenosyl-L-methionine-dependent methyltransferase [Zopfia rhizophila CBS 207.26]|uniref:S-adenosyl-L-methionine-dependent methyltransferase n=1 Tax=Zopfia rhizophila CBS 207.26 TaxID=1314779 RepID=A0A6A6D968_9PEZI|nr:S-adenosyl-L-methionine-dependent methyltransferase [Zopfia rhizophila CBS 207.26]